MAPRLAMISLLFVAAAVGFFPASAAAEPRQSGFENYELKTLYYVSYQRRATDGDLDVHNLGPYENKPLAERVAAGIREDPRNRYVSVWRTTKKNPIRGPYAVPNKTPFSRFGRTRLPGSAITPSAPNTGATSFIRYVNKTVYYVVYDWRHLNGDRGTSELGPYYTQTSAQQTANTLRGGTTVIYGNIRVVSRVIRVPVRTGPDAIRLRTSPHSRPRPQPQPLPPWIRKGPALPR